MKEVETINKAISKVLNMMSTTLFSVNLYGLHLQHPSSMYRASDLTALVKGSHKKRQAQSSSDNSTTKPITSCKQPLCG
eukprot:3626558-Amphidinium_carterae.1